MNRRSFVQSFSIALLAGNLPLPLLAGKGAPPATSAPGPWTCIEECAADCGTAYSARGPIQGHFELIEARPWKPGRRHQFMARFRAPDTAVEGLYELRAGNRTLSLFLQPVPGRRGLMEATFSLVA